MLTTSQSDALYAGMYLPTRELKYFKINSAAVAGVEDEDEFLVLMEDDCLQLDGLSASEDVLLAQSLLQEDVGSIGNSYSPETIFGSDDRWHVAGPSNAPHRSICYVLTVFPDGFAARGTATFVSKSMALTAAHCAYSPDHGGFASSIALYPGRDGSSMPYGPYNVSSVYFPVEYKNDINLHHFDYAALGCLSLPGGTVGYWGVRHNLGISDSFNIIGYPYDKGTQMWGCTGDISVDPDCNSLYRYHIDMLGGMSGGGISTKSSDSPAFTIVGVNGYHADNVHTTPSATLLDSTELYNTGARVTSRLYYFVKSFRVNGES